jgi:D-apiose dehydrogenase
MDDLRGGLVGCGFFGRNHLHAWNEVSGARIAAVCDMDRDRAQAYAGEFGIEGVFADAEEMLRDGGLDFVDIVAQPPSHRPLVEVAARHGVPAICQKPLAPTLEDARAMVAACRDAGIRFMVHENFRWQTPMRVLKEAAAEIGEPFFGRVYWRTAFDVYTDQPYLAEDPRFIIMDMGVHLLDLARFFLGEAEALYCRTHRVNPRVRGEDVATVMLRMRSGATGLVEMSYASKLEEELFPQTLIDLEGSHGTSRLGRDFRVTTVTEAGVTHRDAAPRHLPWSNPLIAHIQESVAAIQQHWTDCLREDREPETSGEDNLRTLELVFGAYESAETGRLVEIES